MEYIILNRTDGITATPDSYKTKEGAEEKIKQLREVFRKLQGYYTTNRRERISPDDIWYEIIEIEEEEEDGQ